MNYYSPKEILEVAGQAAHGKAKHSVPQLLVLAFMAGAYIAFGGLLAIAIGGGVPELEATNPGLQKLLFGGVFPIGLILVAVAGAELFTGNTAYFIPSVYKGEMHWYVPLRNWFWVYIGNFLGALFVAYFISHLTGVISDSPFVDSAIKIAEHKTGNPFYQTFFKGVGCNWLVCLAIWMAMASKDITGKILAIWFPIMTFVAIGFEHCVANMYFIPFAMFEGASISVSDFLISNLIPATLGNITGGVICVGSLYAWTYSKKKKA